MFTKARINSLPSRKRFGRRRNLCNTWPSAWSGDPAFVRGRRVATSGRVHHSGKSAASAEELEADLIVIATHGHSGFQHLLLGSTTEKVIRHAPCPVLVVREATRGPIKAAPEGIVLQKILVPVDFSECANEGARYAAAFAAQVGAHLLLWHVVHPPESMAAEGMIAGPTSAELLETALLEAEDKLAEMVNFLPLDGISAETEIFVGTPVDRLTVITSTHGYSGLRHALLGSTAEKLLRQARCPVLVVPSHCRQVPP